jgi:hypothetical protein
MEEPTSKNVCNCLNTNTSGGQSSNLHLNIVHFFSTGVNETSGAGEGSCFLALVSNTCCPI